MCIWNDTYGGVHSQRGGFEECVYPNFIIFIQFINWLQNCVMQLSKKKHFLIQVKRIVLWLNKDKADLETYFSLVPAGRCWIGLGSNPAGVEFGASASGVFGHA